MSFIVHRHMCMLPGIFSDDYSKAYDIKPLQEQDCSLDAFAPEIALSVVYILQSTRSPEDCRSLGLRMSYRTYISGARAVNSSLAMLLPCCQGIPMLAACLL